MFPSPLPVFVLPFCSNAFILYMVISVSCLPEFFSFTISLESENSFDLQNENAYC